MTNQQLQWRFEDLHTALEYCSETNLFTNGNKIIFSTCERICINQERGSIRSIQAYEKQEIFQHEVRVYVIPTHIEIKVKKVVEKIQATNWGGN